jgi:hypothetical protein
MKPGTSKARNTVICNATGLHHHLLKQAANTKKKEHLQISSVSVPPSLEGPGRVIPDTPLCLGFCATRARRARAVVAAAASLDTSDPSGAFAVISDRCNLHRNEPGCVVGAHRQYLAGALVSEHGGAAAELMVNRSGLATGKREHGVL